jgi:hypothetical protein
MRTIINPIKRVVAVINMPPNVGDKLLHVESIYGKLNGNPTFPSGSWPTNIVSYDQFTIDVTAFLNAAAAVKNKTGTVAARNAAFAVVMTGLRGILSMVQSKADANPANALSIIPGAGFQVKRAKPRGKQQNDALNTEILGTILLTADIPGHHEWQMSKDMVNVTNLPATSTAHMYVEDLIAGDVWYFRNHKVNTKKTTYNWSTWIRLVIGPGGKTVGGGNLTGHAGSLPTA